MPHPDGPPEPRPSFKLPESAAEPAAPRFNVEDYWREGATATSTCPFRAADLHYAPLQTTACGHMSAESPPVPITPILSPELAPPPPATRAAITAGWIRDETRHVRELLDQARMPSADRAAAQAVAADLVRRVRARARNQGVVEAFMRQ
jgi:hypothetical protein